MPILTQEPDCFPADLFECPASTDVESGRKWWLVYTRSRREKDLSRRVEAAGIAYYCPTIRRRTRSPAGRIREAFVPLFPGYVFLFGAEADRYAALATNCVSAIVPVEDGERLGRELRSIRRLLDSNLPVTPESRLETGVRVRVVNGPLRGQEGFVIQRLGRRRLLVAVEMLQRGASADLDECDVESI